MNKVLVLLIACAGLLVSCGESEYTQGTSINDVTVFTLPQADCNGDPCL